VDGCFWHGCPLHAQQPRQNYTFWLKKLSSNKARDKKVNRTLREQGWRVLRIWEHDLSGNSSSYLKRLRRMLIQSSSTHGLLQTLMGNHKLRRKLCP
jgi:DNA mismatch endonuclease (patch repair protein)